MKNNDIVCRRATLSDLGLIVQLEKHNFIDFYSNDQILADLKNDNIYIYLAYLKEKIIGYASFSKVIDEMELLRIAINQEFRNLGFAKDVFLCTLNQHDDVKKVFLEVSSTNLIAIKLYQSLGFVHISIREKYYKDGSDAIIMCLNVA